MNENMNMNMLTMAMGKSFNSDVLKQCLVKYVCSNMMEKSLKIEDYHDASQRLIR